MSVSSIESEDVIYRHYLTQGLNSDYKILFNTHVNPWGYVHTIKYDISKFS